MEKEQKLKLDATLEKVNLAAEKWVKANVIYQEKNREFEISQIVEDENPLFLHMDLEEASNKLKAARIELEAVILKLETMAITLEDSALANKIAKLISEYRRLLNENKT
jgi:hypothetical protein